MVPKFCFITSNTAFEKWKQQQQEQQQHHHHNHKNNYSADNNRIPEQDSSNQVALAKTSTLLGNYYKIQIWTTWQYLDVQKQTYTITDYTNIFYIIGICKF